MAHTRGWNSPDAAEAHNNCAIACIRPSLAPLSACGSERVERTIGFSRTSTEGSRSFALAQRTLHRPSTDRSP
eukprot:scaffold3272_cov239-Pinguiococcus_pyrenoidosus.AAC.11